MLTDTTPTMEVGLDNGGEGEKCRGQEKCIEHVKESWVVAKVPQKSGKTKE
jgi:hypothetical protein